MKKHIFTKVSELYKDVHGYPLRGTLRKLLKGMPDETLHSFYEDLITVMQKEADKIDNTYNDNHDIFKNRILDMMAEYNISLFDAMVWDAEGLGISLSDRGSQNLFNHDRVKLYLEMNKLDDGCIKFYSDILYGVETDKILKRDV